MIPYDQYGISHQAEKNYLGNGATQAAAGVISPLFYGDDQINSPMRQMRELSYEMFLHLDNEFEELEIESPFNKTGIFRTAFGHKTWISLTVCSSQ